MNLYILTRLPIDVAYQREKVSLRNATITSLVILSLGLAISQGMAETSISDTSASFMEKATQRAIQNVKRSVVNVRPDLNWDKVSSLQKLVEERDNDLLSRFYENVKSERVFTDSHRRALRTLLHRLDKRGFDRFQAKFRQVLRSRTGGRDALDFLQYIAPPETGYSGILLDGGYVLTTHFAVSAKHRSDLRVYVPGGERLPGKVKGTYEGFDLALLDIPERQLPNRAEPISIGDVKSSRDATVGHWAITVGRGPRPDKITASRGIVSATQLFAGRFLQMDTFCNYSNTGGAVINIEGDLIGVVRGITLSNTLFAGLNSGVNRAVKPAAIQEVLPMLKKGKEIRSSFLGVQRARGSSPDRGVRVDRVVEGCAAAKAGLKDGDIILSFGNKEIFKWRDLVNKIRRHMPGDRVRIKFKRDGNVDSMKIELTTRECLETGE